MRKINYVEVKRSKASTLKPIMNENLIEYFDIIFNAQSFLYRQIRRIMGSLVAVAKGKITEQDLYEMLTIPGEQSLWNRINIAPPYGLYLADIEFREKCLTNEFSNRNYALMEKCQPTTIDSN